MHRLALAFMDLICSLKERNDPLCVVTFSSVTSVGFSPFYAKAAHAFSLIIWTLCVASPAPSLFHRWRRWGLGRMGALSEVTQTWGVGARIWIPFSCDFTFYVALCSLWTWFPNMRFFPPSLTLTTPYLSTTLRVMTMKQKSTNMISWWCWVSWKERLFSFLKFLSTRSIFHAWNDDLLPAIFLHLMDHLNW